MKLTVKNITIKHLVDFMARCRSDDMKEANRLGVKLEDQTINSMRNTVALVDDNDNVYAIGGIQAIDERRGEVWMLCTYRVEMHPIAFLRASKTLLENHLELFETLENRVWLNNNLHTKWLQWLGAEFHWETVDFTDNSVAFSLKRKQVEIGVHSNIY